MGLGRSMIVEAVRRKFVYCICMNYRCASEVERVLDFVIETGKWHGNAKRSWWS